MFNKFLRCAVFVIYFNGIALSLPMSNLFGNFNIAKIETPFHVRFEVKTSLGSPSVIDSLTSGTHSNRFNIIPRSNEKSNTAENVNVLTIKPNQNDDVIATKHSIKNETIVTNTDTRVLPFNDDISINDVNTEADFSSKLNTELTTDYTTTENYESTTIEYEDEVLNRSGVSPEVVASLLG